MAGAGREAGALATAHDGSVGPADGAIEGSPGSSGPVDAGDADIDDGSDATYAGVVVATIAQGGATNAYSVFADFAPGGPLGIGVCPDEAPDAGSCCCFQGATVVPGFDTPTAGILTLTSTGGSTLATLAPGQTVVEGGSETTTYQGTWDLGTPWFDYPGIYADVNSGAWNPGDALQVRATGGQVAPFSGTLQTGALLAGVSPAIGSTPLVIDRADDLEVSWNPEGRSHEDVFLILQQFTRDGANTCTCLVPDSAASVTVSATLLGPFATEQLSAHLRLERLIISTAPCSNAAVDLASEVSQTSDVTFH
jgi:hypothetical protein